MIQIYRDRLSSTTCAKLTENMKMTYWTCIGVRIDCWRWMLKYVYVYYFERKGVWTLNSNTISITVIFILKCIWNKHVFFEFEKKILISLFYHYLFYLSSHYFTFNKWAVIVNKLKIITLTYQCLFENFTYFTNNRL